MINMKTLTPSRITPNNTTGHEPAVLMFGRRPRTVLSLLNRCTNSSKHEEKVAEQREKLLSNPPRTFDVGEKVYYRDVNHNEWIEGEVQSLLGSETVVTEADRTLVRKHHDHVLAGCVDNES